MDENIGKRFGKLTIIESAHTDKKSKYYICKCDCGNYKTIRLDNLKYRKTTSCGCLKYEKHISVGKKFGCLTVTRITEEKNSDGSFLYECRCTCGKTVKTTAFKLRSGEIKTCGSSEHLIENLIGRKFGLLTPIEFSYTDNRKTYWTCKCDCGNINKVRADHLKSGTVVSCGCKKKSDQNSIFEKQKAGFVDGTNINQIMPDRKMNSNNKTGVKGVSWMSSRQKYRAQITFKGKIYNLGYFDKLEDAAEARKKAEEEMFGGFLQEKDLLKENQN